MILKTKGIAESHMKVKVQMKKIRSILSLVTVVMFPFMAQAVNPPYVDHGITVSNGFYPNGTNVCVGASLIISNGSWKCSWENGNIVTPDISYIDTSTAGWKTNTITWTGTCTASPPVTATCQVTCANAVIKVDIEPTIVNVDSKSTNEVLNLTADSCLGSGIANWTSVPAGISYSGTYLVYNPSVFTSASFVVQAESSVVTSCVDTCLVNLIPFTVTPVETNACANCGGGITFTADGFCVAGGVNWTVNPMTGVTLATSGITATVTPDGTAGGEYTVTATSATHPSCSNSANLQVFRVEVTPQTNIIAAGSIRSATFNLTNSYSPGGAVWSVWPTDGVTWTPETGNYTTVTCDGSLGRAYAVTAAALTNASCEGSAKLVVIKVESETKAIIPGDRKRRILGVGEVVELTLEPLDCTPVTWSISGNGSLSSTSGSPVTFTAHDRASASSVTATYGGVICSITFEVIEPVSEIAVKQSEVYYPAGIQGAGMRLDPITVYPVTVSFRNVEVLEVPGPASNITGYFTNYLASSLYHNANTNWTGLNSWNQHSDVAAIQNYPPPWAIGGFQWDIPVQWRVINSTNVGVLPSRLQVFSIAGTNGNSTVWKLGQSVDRTP